MKLLLWLTVADLALFALLATVAGTDGELNPVVRALWALSPLALLAWKLGPALLLGWLSEHYRATRPLRHIAAIALAVGVGLNLSSIVRLFA